MSSLKQHDDEGHPKSETPLKLTGNQQKGLPAAKI
jgi:hypothetical protein